MILVTGAPGWLGTRLVRALVEGLPDYPGLVDALAGQQIRCLVVKGADVEVLRDIGEDIELVEGDVRAPETLQAFFDGAEGATLYQVAGVIHPQRLRDLHDINVTGVQNVLSCASNAGVRRAVVISSNSATGYSRDHEVLFDEETPYDPFMLYGLSKQGLEEAALAAHASGRIEVVVVRPCWFYGPDQPPRQTEFFRMIRDGKAPIVGDGLNKRSMSYVDHTCQAMVQAAGLEAAAGNIYWVADPKPYPMAEIVDTVERLLEQEFDVPVAHKRLKIPGFVCDIALAADWSMQKVGLYEKRIHVLSEMNKTIACSVDRAIRDLGYEPRVSLEEGMRRSLAWCRERGLL
jgi:nucleoside-diphosphate-sugar epimerase